MDDDGNELGAGVMELNEAELVLHTHRRDDVRWPYLCLRRYGYDSNLFSFESGRRCQTGQGKCCSYTHTYTHTHTFSVSSQGWTPVLLLTLFFRDDSFMPEIRFRHMVDG